MPKGLKTRGKYRVQYSMVGVLLGLWLLFVIGSPKAFLNYPIYASFMSTIPFISILALALTYVIISAQIDLSFPSIMGFSGWIFTIIFTITGNIYLALISSLAVGAIAGLINGVIVVKLGIPSLVATIGTMFFWRGFLMVLSGARGITLVAAKETLLYSILVGRIGNKVPAQMVWTVAFAIVLWFILNRHKFGAHVYHVGDNTESSRMMGIKTDKVKMLVFVILGFCAAFVSIITSLEVNFYWATLGAGYLLKTMSAVFLGGTSVFGGSGTIFGTFIGSLIIGCLEAGIVAIGLTGFWTQLIYGLIIVISVGIHVQINRKIRVTSVKTNIR